MEGNVKFQDAMAQRLEIMQPTREGVEKCIAKERPRFSWGMRRVMKRLRQRGVDIYLVSGGFTQMIEPIAKALQIPLENVYANTILFDEYGNYEDFDRTAPTSKSGGKPAVVRQLKKSMGYKTVVMIGDGGNRYAGTATSRCLHRLRRSAGTSQGAGGCRLVCHSLG